MRRVKGPKIAIVGATGMVGAELLRCLESRRFPVSELLPFSSGAKKKSVRFRGRLLTAPAVDAKALASCDLAFFVSADEVSEKLAPRLARQGVWVIDDSAAFRLDPKVPLVIPEVNAAALSRNKRLIAGPNCTMTGLAVAGRLLHERFRCVAARVASYQAVSGAGRAALEEFFSQTRSHSRRLRLDGGRAPVPPKTAHFALPAPISGNVIPQVGGFDAFGSTSEENKVAAELKKIWGTAALKVSVTAVRVPVSRGHSLAAWLSFARPISVAQASALLKKTPGLVFSANGGYPTPHSVAGKEPVYAGRLRAGAGPRELCLWIVSDNLLKGAALNSVQIAEELLRRGWLRPKS